MSKIEKMNLQIKNAKIKSQKISKIFHYFSEDYTAIQTASTIGCSRQTINHYYKIFRNKILEKNSFEELRQNKFLKEQELLKIKHLNIYKHDVFYINTIYGICILNHQNALPSKLIEFIHKDLKDTLSKHKKANSARVLYNKQNNSYITSGFFKSDKLFEEFLHNRLKKFRGINKNNFHSHLSESVFRYNNQNRNLYEKILETLI